MAFFLGTTYMILSNGHPSISEHNALFVDVADGPLARALLLFVVSVLGPKVGRTVFEALALGIIKARACLAP
jgi:hypothetical protein